MSASKNMDIEHKRKIVAILRILEQVGKPVGSITISKHLADNGIDLRERMIRYYLEVMDQQGLTKNLLRRGRIITEQGRKELNVALIIDKVGFINSRIDELAFQMNFDDSTMSGSVILNLSIVNTDNIKIVQEIIKDVICAGLGMGSFYQIAHAGESIGNLSEKVPDKHIAIGTICSVTINGILLRHGINMHSRFGGLLQLHEGSPVRFSQIINYNGSTIDPLEIFIKGKMTTVIKTAKNGTGSIGASFREIPIRALPAAKVVIDKLEEIGLGGVLMIGRPNQPLLDIPVSTGCVGLIVAGGLNPVAALEESGIATVNHSLHDICDFEQLQMIESIS